MKENHLGGGSWCLCSSLMSEITLETRFGLDLDRKPKRRKEVQKEKKKLSVRLGSN